MNTQRGNFYRIGIFAIGNAGINISTCLINRNNARVEVIAVNTGCYDSGFSSSDYSFRLSNESFDGDCTLAAECARNHESEIRSFIRNYRHIFIIAGMGGAAGTGVAPVIAEFCRVEKIDCEAVAIMPAGHKCRSLKAVEGYRVLRSQFADKNKVCIFKNRDASGTDLTESEVNSSTNNEVCEFIEEKLAELPEVSGYKIDDLEIPDEIDNVRKYRNVAAI